MPGTWIPRMHSDFITLQVATRSKVHFQRMTATIPRHLTWVACSIITTTAICLPALFVATVTPVLASTTPGVTSDQWVWAGSSQMRDSWKEPRTGWIWPSCDCLGAATETVNLGMSTEHLPISHSVIQWFITTMEHQR